MASVLAFAACLAWGSQALSFENEGDQEMLRFEDFAKEGAREDAERAATEAIGKKFPTGTKVTEVEAWFESIGAKCYRYEKYPDLLYCVYKHSRAWNPLVTVEWKISTNYDRETGSVVGHRVNVGLTGL